MLEHAVGLVVQGPKYECMWQHWVQGSVMTLVLRSIASITAWFVSRVCIYNSCKDYWGPQWCLQVQNLGTRIGRNGGQSWWYAHIQLWGEAVGICIVTGASTR